MRDFRMLRRSLLSGVAASAAGAILRPLALHAQTGAAPQRLLLIHRPCGSSSLANGRWFPTGGTTGWTPSPLLSSFTDGKIAALQNQMVVLKGLSSARSMDWLGDQHGAGYLAMLTPPPKDTGSGSWPQSASATASTRADPNGTQSAQTPVAAGFSRRLLQPSVPCSRAVEERVLRIFVRVDDIHQRTQNTSQPMNTSQVDAHRSC